MRWCVIVAIYRAQGAFCCIATARLLLLQSDVPGDREIPGRSVPTPLGIGGLFSGLRSRSVARRAKRARMATALEQVRALVRDVPDFPQPGIVFKDLTPVL